MSFLNKLELILAEDGPNGEKYINPGSASKDNWQTSLQTGKDPEQVRLEAKELNEIVLNWQAVAYEIKEAYAKLKGGGEALPANAALVEGLSKEKMLWVAQIAEELSKGAMIV